MISGGRFPLKRREELLEQVLLKTLVSVASVGASRRHLRKSMPMDSIFTVS